MRSQFLTQRVDISRREAAIYLLNLAAFATATTAIWLYLVIGFREIYFLTLFYYTGGEPGPIPLWVMALMYYAAATNLAFYIAIAMILLKPARKLFELIRHYTYPPYHTPHIRDRPRFVAQSQVRKGDSYSLKLIASTFILTALYLVPMVQFWYMKAPTYVENVLQGIGDGQLVFLAAVFSYLLSVPFGVIGGQFIAEMNQTSIASNLLFLWIPAGFLTIGILNLVYYLYNKLRRRLYHGTKSWLP